MFIELHKNLDTYVRKTKEIKELLITIKQLSTKKSTAAVLNNIYLDLQKALKSNANYSEFGAFVNACDSNINEIAGDFELLKGITDFYLRKRVLNDVVPAEWIQAIIDKGSSKLKGSAGDNKLIASLEDRGYEKTHDLKDFKKRKKAVAKFSSKGDFSLGNIKKKLGESFGSTTQGKKLDLVIKSSNDIYFLEAKHINTGGGAQNKQVLELIEIIKMRPSYEHHHYVSFLDGRYFNKLFFLDSKLRKKNEMSKLFV